MRIAAFGTICLLTLACGAGARLAAQSPVPERALGAPTAVASEPFRNIVAVRELSDGRLIVVEPGPMNAMLRSLMAGIARAAGRGRAGGAADSSASQPERRAARALLFDAKLSTFEPVGRAGTGADEYQQPQRLIGAGADTTYMIDLGRSDMLVIDPAGKIVGAKNVAAGMGAMLAASAVAVARDGRLLVQPGEQVTRNTPAGMEVDTPDSATIVALDLKTGATAPLAHVRVAGNTARMEGDASNPGTMKMHMKTVPFAVIDDWVLMPDGTLAIVRGADLHVDWIAPNGRTRSTPPIAYERQEVTDSDKASFQRQLHAIDSMPMLPRNMSFAQAEPDSFPRFKPPFAGRGARAASDGTIWLPARIRTPKSPEGYDVIGPDGRVRERIHLAKGDQLLGFGKGVVYVTVTEGPRDRRVARIPLH